MYDCLKRYKTIIFNKKVLIIDRESKAILKLDLDKYNRINNKDLEYKLDKYFNRYIDEESIENDISTAYFMVTNKCNLKCEFCSAMANIDGVSNLNFDFVKNEILPKLKKIGVSNIVISGGEPLLVNNLSEIVNEIRKELDVSITLQTNGVIVNEVLVNQLKDKIDYIDCSIQYYFQKMDKYSELEEKVILLKKITKNLGMSFVIDSKNKEFVYTVLDLCNKYDLMLSLKFVDPIGNAINNNVPVLSDADKIDIYNNIINYIIENEYYNLKFMSNFKANISFRESCGACKNIIAINSEGDIFVCYGLMEKEFLIGNIVDTNDNHIREKFRKKDFKFDYSNLFEKDAFKKCRECKIKEICAGKCGAVKHYNNVSINQCDFIKLILIYSAFYYDENESMKENLIKFKECIKQKVYLDV